MDAREKREGAKKADVLVRDLPVRAFHWLLVAAVTAALLSGWLGGKTLLWMHVSAGVAVLGLVIFLLPCSPSQSAPS